MPTDFEVPNRDLKRLHRYNYWTLALIGPAALLAAGLFLAGELPAGAVNLSLTAAAMIVSIGCGGAVVWLFVEGRGQRLWPRLLWAGWAAAAVGVGVGLLQPPVPGAWVVPAALLEAGRLLWSGEPGRYLRRTVVSCATMVASVVVLVVLDRSSGYYALFLAVFFVPSFVGGIMIQWWWYEVAERVDQARVLAGDLAVAEERLRFAAELHDVQGGHLQAIILKTQLARRLSGTDPDRATTELEAVEGLARLALADTRAVVSGYRKVALSDEVDSAARILRSADIQAAVRIDTGRLDDRAEHLLGMLVREATTNILRHSRASAAELSVAADGGTVTATVANDGVPDRDNLPGNGIAMLADRFEEAGGGVDHVRDRDRFTLTGTLPLQSEENT